MEAAECALLPLSFWLFTLTPLPLPPPTHPPFSNTLNFTPVTTPYCHALLITVLLWHTFQAKAVLIAKRAVAVIRHGYYRCRWEDHL